MCFRPSTTRLTGQLTTLKDALNNTSGYTVRRDLSDGRHLEAVTDAMGVPTEQVLDDNGNVLRLIQRLTDNADSALRVYQVTVCRYDVNDNQTHESVPFEVVGDANKYDYEPETIVWQTRKAYDDNGNVWLEADALGNLTAYTYNSHGQLLKTTDSLGNVTSNGYDARGNLVQIAYSDGASTRFSYDAKGLPTAIGNGANSIPCSLTYNADGRMTSSTSANGQNRLLLLRLGLQPDLELPRLDQPR